MKIINCPFCQLMIEEWSMSSEHAIAFSDRYPVVNQHTLVIPRRHVTSIFELGDSELASIWEMVGQVRQHLLSHFHCDSFNIGVNDGLAAGQTVMHAHVHVIPRRNGDVEDPRGGIRWVIPDKARYW